MGTLKDVNRDDLLNRYASHTFTETVIESMTKVEFKDGGSVVVAEAKTLVVDDAYQNIHSQMVGGAGIALGDYTFQGSTKFGGSLTIEPNGAVDVVGTDASTARIRTVRFQASANGAGAVQVGHSRGTESSPSALLSGDRIGQFIFVGDDGSSTNSAGPVIRALCSENWGGSAKGSNILFETIANGATDEALSFTVSENGYPETPEYTVSALPPVGGGGGIIMVTDETGGYTMAFSDATNWRRVQDRAIVA